MSTAHAVSNADSDAMFARVVAMLDATECAGCRKRPNLMFAWDTINKVTITEKPAVAAHMFAEQAVAHLNAAGWRMSGDHLLCPHCQPDARSDE